MRRAGWSFIVFSLGAARLARAQDVSPYPLGEIVVSSRRPVSEIAATVRTVTTADIAAYGARTLDEALSLLPGVEVRTGGGGVPRIDVRGFRGRHVVLLLDGIPLNSTYDGQPDPTLIPVEQIAEIKLMTGPASVLYEQGGLGGVINIVTRRGTDGLTADAGGERRQGNAWLGRGTLSGGTTKASFFVSGSAYTSDGYPSLAGSPSVGPSAARLRQNSDRGRTNLFASASFEPTARLRLGAVISTVHGALGLPPNAITDAADRFANRPVFERIDDEDGLSAHVAGSYALSSAVSIRSWAFINALGEQDDRFDDSTYTSMRDSTIRGTFREHSRTRLSGATAQLSFEPQHVGHVTFGVSAERDWWDANGAIRDVQVGGAGSGGGGGGGGGNKPIYYAIRSLAETRAMHRVAVAVEYEVHPTGRTGIALGYAHHRLEKDSAGHDAADAGSASAFLDVTRATRFHVAAARTIRFPAIRQLYDADGGNRDLQTERATTAEIGVEQRVGSHSSLGVTGFRTQADNYIERPAPGEPFENYDEYRFAGIEAVAETRAISRLFARAGYTYLHTEDRSPGATRQAIQYRPRHRATVEVRYEFPLGMEASASVLRVENQVYYSRQAPFIARRLPDYTLAAARLALPLAERRASVYAGADNLFDTHYEEEYGSPEATRVFYVGLSARWHRPHGGAP